MGIYTGNILSPAAISQPQADRVLIAGMQILAPHNYKKWVEKYGDEDYTSFIATYSDPELVKGRDFFHFEPRAKNQFAVTNTVAVSAPAAGATVTVTIGTADIYQSQSPIRVGETVRIASSGVEAKVLTVDKTSNPTTAHTMTVRPERSDKAFASAGSTDLLVGEVIKLMGNTEAGEASSEINPQMPIDVRITNTTTEIRDDWKATDREEMEEVFYTFDGDPTTGKQGISAYSYKGLVKMETRFKNSRAFKLMFGDIQNNTGLNPSVGTQGLVPAVRERGETATYTPGSLDIAKIHEINRLLDVNGGVNHYHWLQDIYQKQEFDDTLFTQYPAGAFVWGSNEASEEASVAYGFQKFMIDGRMFEIKKQSYFNTEVVYGKTPVTDEFRNWGLLVPMATSKDSRTSAPIRNITLMYQDPVGGGSLGNGIRVWQYGGAAPTPTNGTATHSVSMEAYQAFRVFAANQFLIVTGS